MDENAYVICPHCLGSYMLGVNGTIYGCDVCLKIVRNQVDNTVIEEEDSLTDMEKS